MGGDERLMSVIKVVNWIGFNFPLVPMLQQNDKQTKRHDVNA